MARRKALKRPAPEFADPGLVADFAKDLEADWLFCRTYQHNWKPWSAHWSDHEGCYQVTIRCNRCSTKRVQTMSDKGAVLSSHYEYPEGYLAAGIGRIAGEGRDALRLESVTRVVAHQNDLAARRRKRKGQAA